MNIIIVDDDPLICKSLELMLSKETDIQVLGIANNGAQAVRLCEDHHPELVLMDIRMPDMDGIQATRLIKRSFPLVRVLMLTTFDDKPNIQKALQAGAAGYLLKTEKITDIADKLRMLYTGTSVLDGAVLHTLTKIEVSSFEKLTPREKDVLDLVVQGLTNKEIAGQLFLSEGTVRNVLSVVMDKLNVKNRTQLSLIALGKDGGTRT
jgi:NarL family two-component system response regulator LiaR